ncbi:MAG TPA: hypothetical protein VN643_20970 [Pyrinomonadaceae bacterium]|nr:hypothetical protein [Pyrinomonadaceae bacterium]
MKFLLIITLLGLSAFGVGVLRHYRVQDRLRTVSSPTKAGNVINVAANGDLQRALDMAQCGDTIVLEAGASYLTSRDEGFVFPAKNGAQCTGAASAVITVQSSNLAALPPANRRVEISDARNMPKLITSGPNPAISFAANSKFWKLTGIEITTTANPQYASFLVYLGTSLGFSELPSDVTFDRCYIHSQEDGTNNPHATSRGGVDVEASRVTFSGCRIAFPGGYAGPSKNTDATYAILTVSAPGPITIDNCFLNSWFASLFMGGGNLFTNNTATVAPGATTSQATLSTTANLKVGDPIALASAQAQAPYQGLYYEVAKVTSISGNNIRFTPWVSKTGAGLPLTRPPFSPGGARWNGVNPSKVKITRSTFWINPVIAKRIKDEVGHLPKGAFEIKAADGLVMEGNSFTGWPATLALTLRNQTGPQGAPSPWSVIRNFVFRNNLYDPDLPNGAQLFIFLLEDNIGSSVTGGDFLIENNLFTTGGWVADLYGGSNVVFRHNTFVNNTGWANGRLINGQYGTSGFAFKDNIAWNNEYGVNCLPPPERSSWDVCVPGSSISGNILVTEQKDPYRPNCENTYTQGNFCPQDLKQIGFGPNYELAANSAFKWKATDGKDPGIDSVAFGATGLKPAKPFGVR